MVVSAFYFFTFITSFIMTGINLFTNRKADSIFVLCGIAVTINCFGRYLLSTSDTLEMAIWSNKFLYLGACYAPLFLILVILQICGMKFPKWLITLFFTMSAAVFCSVLTIGYNGFYYKDVQLGFKDGYSYLIKEYGPAHIVFPILMVVYAIVLLYCMITAIRMKDIISARIIVPVSILSIGIIVCYIVERLAHSTIEWLSVGYLAVTILMVYMFDHINMYDMTTNIARSAERMHELGCVVFDRSYRFVNANSYAKDLFPEINRWIPDKEVTQTDTQAYQEIVERLKSWKKGDEQPIIKVKDIYIEISIHNLRYRRNKKVGYIVELTDRTAERRYLKSMENYSANLEREVAEKTADVIHIKDMLVMGMAAMVESRDNGTGGHIRRTSDVVRIFSRYLQSQDDYCDLSDEFLNMVIKAAPMHDLGKIAVNDVVLRKQGKFTDEEYNEMKKHSAEGARIVRNILEGVEDTEFVRIAENVAHYHHEKWNGKGYPCGLSGEDIPIEARIMALADVFDALVSKRCYKDAFSYDKSFSIIESDLGSHFDPVLGKLFLECREELEELYNTN